jgi:hypothetical protein
VGGGEEEDASRFVADASRFVSAASRFATCSPVPLVDARARCAAASPPERRSQELSGGGCRPVPEPMPASPRLMAGLSSSASAGPIGCTSGLDALEFGAFDFGVLTGFLGMSGFFAMGRIWGQSSREKRPRGQAARFIDRQLAALAGRSRFSDSGKCSSTQAPMAS